MVPPWLRAAGFTACRGHDEWEDPESTPRIRFLSLVPRVPNMAIERKDTR